MRPAIRSSGVYSRTDRGSVITFFNPFVVVTPVISLIGNRPALQIGRYQVIDYDTAWLDDALERAATAAGQEDFPFVEDIRSGVIQYLETKCPLKVLLLEDLFDRMRKMLVKIGCERIAEKLQPLAPPLTVSLIRAAMEAGNGFELAFFETLRIDLVELRAAGAEEVHFTGLRESALILRGVAQWNAHCQNLLCEIEEYLKAWNRDQPVRILPLRLLPVTS